MSAVEEIGQAIGATVENVGPAVVGVGRGWRLGSGVVIAEGTVLTNAHNLRGAEVTVVFADGRRAEGEVRGVDADADVAVVAADTGAVTPVTWEPYEEAPVLGTPVFALANPGGRGARASVGWVSGTGATFRGPRGRRSPRGIEHSAPLPRGSSGGPLLDEQGRLLGLNTVRLDGGLILALATDAAMRARVDALARGESTARRRLGVQVAPSRVARRLRRSVGLPERDGLLVREVAEGTRAHHAGLAPRRPDRQRQRQRGRSPRHAARGGRLGGGDARAGARARHRRAGGHGRLRRGRAHGLTSMVRPRCTPSPSRRPTRSPSSTSPSPSCRRPTTPSSRVHATGVCGKRPAHLPRAGRRSSPGFTIGHEYVGGSSPRATGSRSVAVGDRVLGCFQVACGTRFFAARALPQVRRPRARSATGRRSAGCRAPRPS